MTLKKKNAKYIEISTITITNNEKRNRKVKKITFLINLGKLVNVN